MNVVLLGVFPPPIGGVSIHVQRLAEYLLEQGHSVEVLDYPGTGGDAKPTYVIRLPRTLPGKLWFIGRFARRQTPNTVIHFHVAAMARFRLIAPLLFLMFRRQPKLITVHSGLFTGERQRWLAKVYLRWVLLSCHHIIPVTDELAVYLQGLGVPAQRMTVIPAYIAKAPQVDRLPADLARLKPTRKLVMTSGFLMPPYNYDVLIRVMAQLDRDRFHFVFVFYAETDPQYEAAILGQLAAFENVTILRDQPPDVFLSTLRACDIYVRTTVMDGDAITIREALDFGCTVFATDSVKRPEACRLFRYDDPASLRVLFDEWGDSDASAPQVNPGSNAQRVLHLYEALIASRRTGQNPDPIHAHLLR